MVDETVADLAVWMVSSMVSERVEQLAVVWASFVVEMWAAHMAEQKDDPMVGLSVVYLAVY